MRTGVITVVLLAGILGCQSPELDDPHVARVGDAYLTRSSLQASMTRLAVGLDTTEVSRQLIDHWVTSELLYQEARRLRLETRADIREKLEESERAVLIQSIVELYHTQEEATLSPIEISTYFESNKENMRLLEPFVQVRHFHTTDSDSARMAANLLNQATRSEADSVFDYLAMRFAVDAVAAAALARNFYPERSLFVTRPAIRNVLGALTPGRTARVIESDTTWHVLQLVDRAPEGSLPELIWIEDHLREQLLIQWRKQNYASAVQKLRTEADARDDIEIRY